jgi:hypothetical protein
MKRLAIIFVILASSAAPALAWDGPGMWYRAADNMDPGGGGILGTGGQHDYGIQCTDCHVDRVDEPGLAFDLQFTPALVNNTFVAGQTYAITATMTGGNIPCPTNSPNGVGKKVRNFAASFETDTGGAAGRLAADDGQSAPSCTLPSPAPAGTTALDGDCKVVFGQGVENVSVWRFSWTAPASTTSPVHVFWGAIDGNCDMMSMKDAAVTGSFTMMAPPRPPPAIFAIALVVRALLI